MALGSQQWLLSSHLPGLANLRQPLRRSRETPTCIAPSQDTTVSSPSLELFAPRPSLQPINTSKHPLSEANNSKETLANVKTFLRKVMLVVSYWFESVLNGLRHQVWVRTHIQMWDMSYIPRERSTGIFLTKNCTTMIKFNQNVVLHFHLSWRKGREKGRME